MSSISSDLTHFLLFVFRSLHEEVGADVGEFGTGMDGIALTESDDQAKTLPWAVQYLKCDASHNDVCKNHDNYCAKCWIDREDKVKPDVEQKAEYGGQVSWHPGWRTHQLTGRVLAFSVLEALQLAIQEFSDGTMGKPRHASGLLMKYQLRRQPCLNSRFPSLEYRRTTFG